MFMVYAGITLIAALTFTCLCVSLSPNYLFYKDASHNRLGTTIVTSFELGKRISPNKGTLLKYFSLGLQHGNLRRPELNP